MLPAYWYHQVESFAPPGGLNIAINYWFQGCVAPPTSRALGGVVRTLRRRHSLATRLYRTLRENTFTNCTMPPPPGKPDVCRDSLLERT